LGDYRDRLEKKGGDNDLSWGKVKHTDLTSDEPWKLNRDVLTLKAEDHAPKPFGERKTEQECLETEGGMKGLWQHG